MFNVRLVSAAKYFLIICKYFAGAAVIPGASFDMQHDYIWKNNFLPL